MNYKSKGIFNFKELSEKLASSKCIDKMLDDYIPTPSKCGAWNCQLDDEHVLIVTIGSHSVAQPTEEECEPFRIAWKYNDSIMTIEAKGYTVEYSEGQFNISNGDKTTVVLPSDLPVMARIMFPL